MTLIEEYKTKSGKTLQIIQDEDPQSPREWDNLGTMACFHNRYTLGDGKKIHLISHEDFKNWDEMENHIRQELKAVAVLPLYLYDHGGITIATTPFSCRWDSGQVGFIYITQECLNKSRITQGSGDGILDDESNQDYLERLEKYLKCEVETYDQYLRGDVYGFLLKNKEGDIEDSCWGFYGDNIKENGILDHIADEDHPIDEL
jgi:hypothetical protein